jgi:protein SCO1/2
MRDLTRSFRVIGVGIVVTAACISMGAARRTTGYNRPAALPFYRTATSGPTWLAPTDAAKLPRIAAFTLSDQHGATVTEAEIAGRISVVAFFFTTCRGLCPNLYTSLATVARTFADAPDVRILSHTVTPEIDDVATLARYADAHHITDPHWHLLTGAPQAIRELALRSYLVQLGDTAGNATGTMVHTETVVLVDGDGHIRGMYDGSLAFDTERLMDDIRTLRARVH